MHAFGWSVLSIVGLALAACDPPAGAGAAEPSTPISAVAPLPESKPVIPHASPLQVEVPRVRRRGDEVEIEVVLDRPIAPTGRVRPTLEFGETLVRRSRFDVSGRLDRLIFTMPAEQFDRLSPDVEITFRAGFVTNAASPRKPRLADVPITIGVDDP
jgi:hypothetical protein